MTLHPTDFFDLNDSLALELCADCTYVWEIVPRLETHLARLTSGRQTLLGSIMPGAHLSDRPLYIAESARIEPGACLVGPAYIGPGVTVRHGAYVRENVILLAGSVLGHASEAKNCLFLPGAYAPHFNYIGDSILGQRVNLGAGTILSNLGILSVKDSMTGRRSTLRLTIDQRTYDTGLTKLGAILGDDVQTGCNSVLNPGCLVAPRSLIYAGVSLRKGYYPADTIVKLRQTLDLTPRQ